MPIWWGDEGLRCGGGERDHIYDAIMDGCASGASWCMDGWIICFCFCFCSSREAIWQIKAAVAVGWQYLPYPVSVRARGHTLIHFPTRNGRGDVLALPSLSATPSVPKYKDLESSNSRNNSERKWLIYPSFYTTNQLSTYSPTSFNFVLSFQDLIFWHKIWSLQDPIFWDGGSS
jgi:hypothetical protein